MAQFWMTYRPLECRECHGVAELRLRCCGNDDHTDVVTLCRACVPAWRERRLQEHICWLMERATWTNADAHIELAVIDLEEFLELMEKVPA